jgi:hypothetical protein
MKRIKLGKHQAAAILATLSDISKLEAAQVTWEAANNRTIEAIIRDAGEDPTKVLEFAVEPANERGEVFLALTPRPEPTPADPPAPADPGAK